MKYLVWQRSCIALAVFFVCASGISTEAQISRSVFVQNRSSSAATDVRILERVVFEVVNRTREANGLQKLVWSEKAAQAARLHSVNMANFGFFSHEGVDGNHVSERAAAAGIRDWESVGENIAYNSGFENPAERALRGWMNSAGHRKNILRGNWRETGIGIAVTATGKYFFTQVFVKRR